MRHARAGNEEARQDLLLAYLSGNALERKAGLCFADLSSHLLCPDQQP